MMFKRKAPLLVLLFCCLTSLSASAQVRLMSYTGAHYHLQPLVRVVPDNARQPSTTGFSPMYSATQGLGVEWQPTPWGVLQGRLGYNAIGMTLETYDREEAHYLALQLDALVHPVKAPQWLQRLWIGAGVQVKGRIGYHSWFLVPFFGYQPSRAVACGQWRAKYDLTQRLAIELQYERGWSPYLATSIPNTPVENLYLHRSFALTVAYQLCSTE